MSTETFPHDVFLSHSAKDKALVRPLAERLRADGPSTFGTRTSEFGLPRLCMSAHVFGSDSAHLACPAVALQRRRKAGTCGRRNLRFRDALNKERRFIPLRLDDAPIKGGARNGTVTSPAALDLGKNANIYEAGSTVVRYGR